MNEAGLLWLRMVYHQAGANAEWQHVLRELSAHTQATTATIIIAATAGA